jgi:antitoxin CptB
MHAEGTRRKLHYRAWHRGTREADALVGGFYDHYADSWDAEQFAWFERLIEEQDVDIMAWAMSAAQPPASYEGKMMDLLRHLDFISLPIGLKGKASD